MPISRAAFVTRDAIENQSFKFINEQDQYLHDKLFPYKVVKKASTKLYQYDSALDSQLVETQAPTDSVAAQVDWNVFSTDITLEEHKLKAKVNPRDARDADTAVSDFEMDAAQTVMTGLLIKKEYKAATLATTVGNYPSDLTTAIASGSRWNEAGGDPEADKVTVDNAMIARCGKTANAVLMSGTTFRKLKISPAFRDRIKYTTGGPVTMEACKAFFDVTYFFVGDATYNSAKEGAAKTTSSFWGDNVIFFHHDPSAGLRSMSYGQTLILNQFWNATYDDPERQGAAGKVRWVTMGMEYKMAPGFVVGASDSDFAAGYLVRTAVA